MAIGVSWAKTLVSSDRWPILENPPIDAKILHISFTETEL